jgi:hypothetical protein
MPTDPEPTEYPDTTRRLGDGLQAVVARVRTTHQRAAARDPERWLYVPEAEPSQAGVIQERWLRLLGGRGRLATWRLSNVTHHVADRAEVVETWLDKGRRKPLLIEGRDSGTGKSSLAAATAHAWWQHGARSVLWANVAELTTPRSDHADALARVGPLTLVVLDDLTTQAVAWQSFTATVERLHAAEGRLVTTSNLTPEQWNDPEQVDPRVRRRLRDDAQRVPMPDVRLMDDPPEGPRTDPCPYRCSNGQLVLDDHPTGYEVAERYAAVLGYARMPDPDAWADQPERYAELRAKAERQFEALMAGTVVACPWEGHR